MKIYITIVLLSFATLLTMGCTSTRGIVELHTKPPGAIVYLDETQKGVTPLVFEYDFMIPTTLRLEKQGYYSEIEALCKSWVIREIRKGSYTEGTFTIQGEAVKAWKVTTSRRLQKNREQP